MKTLLIFVLCLVTITIKAASPAFTGFRGVAPINVTTNPSAGTVTVSGGGGAGTLQMNQTQFDTNNPISLITGYLSTNPIIKGVITQSIPNVGAYVRLVTNNVATNAIPWVESEEVSFGGQVDPVGPNQVYRMGWNTSVGGAALDATQPVNFDTWEGNYSPATGDRRLERHMTFGVSNGTPLRFFTADRRWSLASSLGSVGVLFNADTFGIQNRSNTSPFMNMLANSPSNATFFFNNGSQIQFSEWTGFNSQLIQLINPTTESIISYDQPNDRLQFGSSTAQTVLSGGSTSINFDNHFGFIGSSANIGVNNAYPANLLLRGGISIGTNNADVTTGTTLTKTNGVVRLSGSAAQFIVGSEYPTNNAPTIPSAATLGLGGYRILNSNGFLVVIYTLNGTTTVMKQLAP